MAHLSPISDVSADDALTDHEQRGSVQPSVGPILSEGMDKRPLAMAATVGNITLIYG